MNKVIKFPREYKKSEVTENNDIETNITEFSDHKALMYQAKSEGVTYRQLRDKLRIHRISLETAIENTRNGISTEKYLRRLEEEKKIEETKFNKVQRNLKVYFGTMIAASLAALTFSVYESITKPKEISCYQYGIEARTATSPEMKLKIEKYMAQCYPKIIRGT